MGVGTLKYRRQQRERSAEQGLPPGYMIRQTGPAWFTLFGPNGEKIGKAKHTPEEAASQLKD